MQRIRYMTLDLRPAALDDLGLLPALDAQIRRYTDLTNVQVSFDHQGLNDRFSPDVETAAYRIIQEALTNVARHANVTSASVSVVAQHSLLRMKIEDHGRGMTAPEAPTYTLSSGLSGMHERALSVGGEVEIRSGPTGGTIVEASLPITPT